MIKEFKKLTSALNKRDTWFLLFSLLIAAALPWSNKLPNYGIIVLLLFFLFDKKLISKLKNSLSNKLVWLPILFFIFHLISYYISSTCEVNSISLSVRLSFLVFPLIYASENKFNFDNIRLINSIFILSCFILIIFLELYGIYRFAETGYWNKDLLAYQLLAQPVMHCGVLSAYLFFGLVLSTQQLLFGKKETFLSKSLVAVFTVLCLVFLAQLASKIVFLLFILYILWVIYYAGKVIPGKSKRRMVRLLAIISIPIFLVVVYVVIENRIKKIPVQLRHVGRNVPLSNSTGSRAVAWKVGVHAFLERPFLGYGAGSGNAVLIKFLDKNGYKKLASDKMHTHNEFLKVCLELGLVGLLLLACFIVIHLRLFVSADNYSYLWLTISLIFVCAVDDVLSLESGVMFYLFFLSINTYRCPGSYFGKTLQGYLTKE